TTKSKHNSHYNDSEVIDLLSEKIDGVAIQPCSSSSSSLMMTGNSAKLANQPSGLPNLGNTCYFNSVMQVMAQTYPLHHFLRERCQPDFQWNARTFFWNQSKQAFTSESLHLSLPSPNSLMIDFLHLQEQIFAQKSTNPRSLLSDIQREKQQFDGFAQQDAQELLITLLDTLKKSEIVRQKHALLKGLRIEDRRNPTAEDRENAQRYKITAKHTVIDSIFGGQLLSIIHCNVCDYRSFSFEPFIDLALSLDTTFPQSKPNNVVINKKQQSTKMTKKNRKKNIDIDDVECEADVESCDEQTAINGDDDNSLAGRKKRRQEKKAARRAERKQMKLKNQQQHDNINDGCDVPKLKRFEASGFGLNKHRMMHKLNTRISFPYKLYLSPYTSRIYEYFSRFYEPDCDPDDLSDWNDRRLEYTLYAVVIHSGSLRFGHYMAYVCVRPRSFDAHNIRRFLHLKPFVSNIEHIMQFVHEDLDHKNDNPIINGDDDPISTNSTSSEPDSSNNQTAT
ncbi:ubiquitin carboxyl-terminal hydrolase 16-like protein, partial [Euroglyphus maynei]